MNEYFTASAVIKGTNVPVKVYNLAFKVTAAKGTVSLQSGGSAGTTLASFGMAIDGDSFCVEFPSGIVCDYITISNALVNLEYKPYKQVA